MSDLATLEGLLASERRCHAQLAHLAESLGKWAAHRGRPEDLDEAEQALRRVESSQDRIIELEWQIEAMRAPK